ncbi:10615_t:CDS:2, partial [Funneliformis caledonium]
MFVGLSPPTKHKFKSISRLLGPWPGSSTKTQRSVSRFLGIFPPTKTLSVSRLLNTLEETIESLLLLDPPINKKASASNQKKALTSSLKPLLKNEESQKEYEPLRVLFSVPERKKDNKRKLKIIEKENLEQKRNVQNEQENVREIKNVHRSSSLTSGRESSPPIPQRFSFSSSEQGSYVEPILEHVERALFRFIVNNEEYIPLEAVESFTTKCNPPRQVNFSDADLLCILNFIIQNINLFTTGRSNQTLFHGEYKLDPSELFKSFKIEARNRNAHAITQQMGRWNDEELQRLSTLALKVIVCLGDKESYDPLVKIKRELDNKLIERLTLKTDQKRFNEVAGIANQENEDEYCTDLFDFALDIINKLKSSKEENIKQILKLAVNQDSMFMNIYKSLVLRKDKSVIVEKFIAIMNIQYEM